MGKNVSPDDPSRIDSSIAAVRGTTTDLLLFSASSDFNLSPSQIRMAGLGYLFFYSMSKKLADSLFSDRIYV